MYFGYHYISLSVWHGSHVCCKFLGENQVKAVQLGVMEELLEALILHKANAGVARSVAGAIWTICVNNGNDQRYYSLSQQNISM